MSNIDIRQMVREVLREAIPTKSSTEDGVEQVRISSDADLMVFARRAIEMQSAIKSGKLRFSLAGNAAAHVSDSVSGPILQGVVTEHVVDRHASKTVLLLAPGTVMTPLARDRARKLNLKIERSI